MHKRDDAAAVRMRQREEPVAVDRTLPSRPTSTATGKTPETTGGFWLTQALIAGTAACAATALSHAVGRPVAAAASAGVLAVALTAQFRSDRYRVWVYWATVAATGVTGALAGLAGRDASGNVVVWIGVAVAVVSAAAVASRLLGTVTPPFTPPTGRAERGLETLYWAAVLATCAAGAAAVRLTAGSLPMGHALSQALFAVLVVGCSAAQWLAGTKAVACVWAAWLTVRSLGVSFAQWLATPLAHGGLGWGQGPVTVLLGVIAAGQLGRFAEREQTGGLPSEAPDQDGDR
ncbi:hypothetical protein [Actinacidiphila acidipaludis]|uniref:Uncharacterized protein n=1 Tax=Actinacidiphila acidipaludis TaxID=2873382 RepID=A0ABS7PZG6_9ACTN|nr:hypothetical protein [Streptomyces acidipaludis]MBY8876279.1 hypothetical protein [Streptomyces acidipaludis]